jgi:hypothetical protein
MAVTPRAAGDLLTATIFNTKLEAPLLLTEIPDGLLTGAKLAAGAVGPAQLAIVEAVRVRHSVDQAAANGAYTTLSFDTELSDVSAMHAAGTPARLTAVTAGVYIIGASVQFANSAVGMRQLTLFLNSTTYFATLDALPNTSFGHTMTVTGLMVLAAGDYVTCQVYQNSGGSLNVTAAAAYSPAFWMARLGRVA